jgi:hypothetical protein
VGSLHLAQGGGCTRFLGRARSYTRAGRHDGAQRARLIDLYAFLYFLSREKRKGMDY